MTPRQEYKEWYRKLRVSLKSYQNGRVWENHCKMDEFHGWVNEDRLFLWYAKSEGMIPVDGDAVLRAVNYAENNN